MRAVFPSFIVQQTLDINCLELLTIIVALKLWGSRWSGLRLSVRCDNEVAVTVLNTGLTGKNELDSGLDSGLDFGLDLDWTLDFIKRSLYLINNITINHFQLVIS